MNPGTFSAAEIGVLLAAALPWLAAIAAAGVGLVLLRRLALAAERIARAVEALRRDG